MHMIRKCPRCNIFMQLLNVRGIEIDVCPRCMGIWFDSSELDKVLGSSKSFEEMAYLAKPLGEKINCPNCQQKMHYSTIEDTTIDFCTRCEGVWLDAGELTDLAGHLPESPLSDENTPHNLEITESEGFISKVKTIFSKK